ncbi:inorganic phosphate transporter [Chitinivibrio alkaliphilus]|uniref:Phosphate transporter n=1 Tax=Chitinivibrio alkaliphilus ACht1 TaxID=1313304 RepID=U7D5H3_9BACT|nr:inorganic phosphate transporter [Chitinivibrio alkaliphilus]ERP31774.1 phosphate transporter [Chitinivibrio alkaliphilus ACht1]
MIRLTSSILLGWGLGANDSANIFGTAVASRVVPYTTAIVLSSIFILAGALFQGQAGVETISTFSGQGQNIAFITSLSAAIAVIILTLLKLPISTSQAVVGAILGVQIFGSTFLDLPPVQYGELFTILICWLATPVGGLFFTLLFYHLLHTLFQKIQPDLCTSDLIVRYGLIIAGCYGAYALGANNVANVTGVYTGEDNLLTPFTATLLGGISIAVGVLTYSRHVMMTIGKNIIPLDAFSALVTVLSHGATIHVFAMIGVPVSSSQAIVGAVIGIGIIKNYESIQYKTATKVFSGWIITPAIAFSTSFLITFLSNLRLEV